VRGRLGVSSPWSSASRNSPYRPAQLRHQPRTDRAQPSSERLGGGCGDPCQLSRRQCDSPLTQITSERTAGSRSGWSQGRHPSGCVVRVVRHVPRPHGADKSVSIQHGAMQRCRLGARPTAAGRAAARHPPHKQSSTWSTASPTILRVAGGQGHWPPAGPPRERTSRMWASTSMGRRSIAPASIAAWSPSMTRPRRRPRRISRQACSPSELRGTAGRHRRASGRHRGRGSPPVRCKRICSRAVVETSSRSWMSASCWPRGYRQRDEQTAARLRRIPRLRM